MMKRVFFLLFLLWALLIPSGFSSPNDDGFSHYVTISLDADDFEEALTNFPVLIHLSSSCGLNGFDATPIFDEIGDHFNYIAFSDADGNYLFFDPSDGWNATAQEAWVWVKVPSISAVSDTVITLWFENFVDGSTYNNPPEVWSDYVGVWHMNDDPDTSSIKDSTSNGNDGTKTAINEPIETDGQIGKAQDFDGTDDFISVAHNAVLESAQKSVFVKVYVRAVGGDFGFVMKGDNIGTGAGYTLGIQDGNKLHAHVYDGAGDIQRAQDINIIPTNEWIYAGFTHDGAVLRLYLNAVEVASVAAVGYTADADPLYLSRYAPFGAWYLNGIMDELQQSSATRSPAWVSASYLTQTDSLITFGMITLYVADLPSRGEFIAAAVVGAFILVPLLILTIALSRRRR